jgi:ribulose-5-phosphate 4-epimerase/fuculose-1-phosphate aldolase
MEANNLIKHARGVPNKASDRLNLVINHLNGNNVSNISNITRNNHHIQRHSTTAFHNIGIEQPKQLEIFNQTDFDEDIPTIPSNLSFPKNLLDNFNNPVITPPRTIFKSMEVAAVKKMRKLLSKICFVAHQLQLVSHIVTDSFSILVPGHGYLMKPIELRMDEVTPENLILIKNMRDLPKLHVDMYLAKNTSCVFSIKNESCELVSLTKEGFLPLSQDAIRLHGCVQRVEEENLGFRATRGNYRNVTCWLVKKHGIVCGGKTPELGFLHLVLIIKACAFQVRALGAVGGDLSRLEILSSSELLKSQALIKSRISDEEMSENLLKLGDDIINNTSSPNSYSHL